MPVPFPRLLATCGALLIAPALHAATITLDWNSVLWTSGQLTQSFDIDPANPGNDVTITISGDTNRIASPVGATTLITAGVSPTNKTLQLVTDFANNLESIVVRIDFNYFEGVSGVNLLLHDIDGDGVTWKEEVRGIVASNNVPSNFGPTQVLALNASPTFTSTGSGLSRQLTGTQLADDAANTGSASIAFGNQLTYSTSFRFGASTTGTFDPVNSGISLGTVTYTTPAVPEPTSSMLLLAGATLAGFVRSREK